MSRMSRMRRLTIDEVELLSPEQARRMSNLGLESISMRALLDQMVDLGDTRGRPHQEQEQDVVDAIRDVIDDEAPISIDELVNQAASLVGASTEEISQAIQDLGAQGLIQVTGGLVTSMESRKHEQEAEATRLLSTIKAAGGVLDIDNVDTRYDPDLIQQLVDAGELIEKDGILWLPDLFHQQLGASRTREAGSLVDQVLRGADPDKLLNG